MGLQLGAVVYWWIGSPLQLTSFCRLGIRLLLAFDFSIALPIAAAYLLSEWRYGSIVRLSIAASHAVGILTIVPCVARYVTGAWAPVLPSAAGISIYVLAVGSFLRARSIPAKVQITIAVTLGLLMSAQCIRRVALWPFDRVALLYSVCFHFLYFQKIIRKTLKKHQ